jgi:hypothetical protein
MKFWCKLPEDGDNAETYGSKVIERKINRLVCLLMLPRVLTKPEMFCSATHFSDLRSEEICTSTNQKQQLKKKTCKVLTADGEYPWARIIAN